MNPTTMNPLFFSSAIGNGVNNTSTSDNNHVGNSFEGIDATELFASRSLGSDLIRQSQQQQQQLQLQLQQQHLQQLHQQHQFDSFGNVSGPDMYDSSLNQPNQQSAAPTFNQLQHSSFSDLQANMIMNALQATQNQAGENGNIEGVGNLFTAMGAETLLAAAMAAANANGRDLSSQEQKSPGQQDFQELCNQAIFGQTNPTSAAELLLSERLDQLQPQCGELGQPQPRNQVPQFLGQYQNNARNPFAAFDNLQQMQSLSSLDGPSDTENNIFHENSVANQPITNAAGDISGLSNERGDATGGIQLLQQKLANLQQQVLLQQLQHHQMLQLQQQSSPMQGANLQAEHYHHQLLVLQRQINDQSLQFEQQKQLTHLQQPQNHDNGPMSAWMHETISGQNSVQNLGQNFNLTFNPATLSLNGSLGGLSGISRMSGLQQFPMQLQGQQIPPIHQDFSGIRLLTGVSPDEDVGVPTNQSGTPINEIQRVPERKPCEPPIKSKKSKEGTGKKKKAKTFPEKLMEAIVDYSDEEAIAWLPDGKSFVIVNPDLFCTQILSHVFKESKYASFIRKLHRWGFVRLTSGTGTDCFHHALFQRNRSELVGKIVCASRGDKDEKINTGTKHANKPPSLAGVEKFIRAKVVAAVESGAFNPKDHC